MTTEEEMMKATIAVHAGAIDWRAFAGYLLVQIVHESEEDAVKKLTETLDGFSDFLDDECGEMHKAVAGELSFVGEIEEALKIASHHLVTDSMLRDAPHPSNG